MLEDRVRVYNWTKERAIHEPKRQYTGEHTRWGKIAESNGINKHTFASRVSNGWGYKKAATTPVHVPLSKHSSNILETLDKSNINIDTFYQRLKNGWTEERASTTPVRKYERRYKND
ncbi:hypothetical protein [Clostridium cadaveris]|uniref:hypothetical protein n=1 Tax=Clostridium cadaveris TaxID=1529 RepID=UPI0015B70F56|nr:hypothetical protein [Clostridium cadaveris]NWK11762.1 hypothetical protein [Clostridium cadaveris]